jgi:hypothetical protein
MLWLLGKALDEPALIFEDNMSIVLKPSLSSNFLASKHALAYH